MGNGTRVPRGAVDTAREKRRSSIGQKVDEFLGMRSELSFFSKSESHTSNFRILHRPSSQLMVISYLLVRTALTGSTEVQT